MCCSYTEVLNVRAGRVVTSESGVDSPNTRRSVFPLWTCRGAVWAVETTGWADRAVEADEADDADATTGWAVWADEADETV